MIDDQLREQAALYAIDALPADEAARFREMARLHPELAQLAEEYEHAAAQSLEHLSPRTPPPALRSRILASVRPPETAGAARSNSMALAGIGWGIAAGLAIATGALWLQNAHLDDERTQLAERAAQVEPQRVDLAVARDALAQSERTAATLRTRIADLEKRNALAEMQVATLTSKLDASYLASIAWDNDAQEGILKVRRLPAPERGKDYQLWVFEPGRATPISAGVFSVQPDGSATIRFAPAQKVGAAGTFAVSLEPTGGSPSPKGPVVLSN